MTGTAPYSVPIRTSFDVMTTAKEVMTKLAVRLSEAPEQAARIGASYRFDLSGEGGGHWVVNLNERLGIEEGKGPADCIIGLSAKDFEALFDRKANAQQLFFAGRLKIEGDLTLAIRLEQLVELLSR